MTPRRELVEPNAPLSMRWQCELLGVNRSSLYYEPVEPDGEQLALMRRMDELHLKHPFFGSRMMTQILKAEGSAVNRKRVQRLMRLMGLESTAPKPNTSKPAPEHTVYPLLFIEEFPYVFITVIRDAKRAISHIEGSCGLWSSTEQSEQMW